MMICINAYVLFATFKQKRNSFFNLHRPELKGLSIVPTENQQDKMLHQHILKEVMTIHKIQSM